MSVAFRDLVAQHVVVAVAVGLVGSSTAIADPLCIPGFSPVGWSADSFDTLLGTNPPLTDPLWASSARYDFSTGGASAVSARYVYGVDGTNTEYLYLALNIPVVQNNQAVDPVALISIKTGPPGEHVLLHITPRSNCVPAADIQLCTSESCSITCANRCDCRGQRTYFKAADSTQPDRFTIVTLPTALDSAINIQSFEDPSAWRLTVRLPLAAAAPLGVGLGGGAEFAVWTGQVDDSAGTITSFERIPEILAPGGSGRMITFSNAFGGGVIGQVHVDSWAWTPLTWVPSGAALPQGCGYQLEVPREQIGVGDPANGDIGQNVEIDTTGNDSENLWVAGIRKTGIADLTLHDGTDLELSARFFRADWGTQARFTRPWNEVGGGPSRLIDNGGSFPTPPMTVMSNDIFYLVRKEVLTYAKACRYLDVNELEGLVDAGIALPCPQAGDRSPHQCLAVQFESKRGDLVRPAKVFRNMRFVAASTFQSEVRADIRGNPNLEPAKQRELYLYVFTKNMPSTIAPADRQLESDIVGGLERAYRDVDDLLRKNDDKGLRSYLSDALDGESSPVWTEIRSRLQRYEDARRDVGTLVRRVPSTLWRELLLERFPTYEIVAFVDSGRTVDYEGRRRRVLVRQTSFGYYVSHNGPIVGWDHAIDGPGSFIRPGVYKINLPDEGFARLRTRIRAVEEEGTSPLSADGSYGGAFDVKGEPWRPDPIVPDEGDECPRWVYFAVVALLVFGLVLLIGRLRAR